MNYGEELLPRALAQTSALIVDNKRRRFNKTSAVLHSQIGGDAHPKAIHILHRPGIVNKFQFDCSKYEIFIPGSDACSQPKKGGIIKQCFVLWSDHRHIRKHNRRKLEP